MYDAWCMMGLYGRRELSNYKLGPLDKEKLVREWNKSESHYRSERKQFFASNLTIYDNIHLYLTYSYNIFLI